MAFTIQGKYCGQLRCELTHTQSNSNIQTDAPTDNQGKGESFSPTDLVAAALGSCMLTIIGIRANKKGIKIEAANFNINKRMKNNPRKIEEIEIEINLPDYLSEDERSYLEQEALNCPVALSLDPNLKQVVSFNYD